MRQPFVFLKQSDYSRFLALVKFTLLQQNQPSLNQLTLSQLKESLQQELQLQ